MNQKDKMSVWNMEQIKPKTKAKQNTLIQKAKINCTTSIRLLLQTPSNWLWNLQHRPSLQQLFHAKIPTVPAPKEKTNAM